jgi:sarcosine oxidase subunit beta
VIVGAGVIGLACAYALQRSGASVCVVEQHLPGSGQSTRTGGGIRLAQGSAINVELTRLSLPTWRNFAAEFGVDPQFHETGHLFISSVNPATRTDTQSVPAQETGKSAYCGTTQSLDAATVQARWQALKHLRFNSAEYCETGGYLDHFKVIQGYQETLRRNGVEIRPGVRVERLLSTGPRHQVCGVSTRQGDFSAAMVVNAAGAGAASVATLAGLDIPFRSRRHELLIARAEFSGPKDVPWLIDVDRQVHLRPDGPGRALIGGFLGRDEVVDPDHYARENDRVWVRDVRIAAAKAFGLSDRNCKILSGWAGLYPGTADYLPVLELSKPGLITAAGFSGVGLMHAPAIGQIVNGLTQGKPDEVMDISMLASSRFDQPSAAREKTGF